MNEMQVFNNSEFGELGVLEIGGKAYFPATACAKILGYVNPHKAVIDHCKGDGLTKREVVSQTTNQHGVTTSQTVEMKFINEGNLYRLIVSSKLPSAEKFERWVFDEVLPTIRQTGGYGNLTALVEPITSLTKAVSNILSRLEDLENQREHPPVVEHFSLRRKRETSIISRLDIKIKQQVEDMICCGMYTYSEIAQYLNSLGIDISMTSVWRYAQSIL